jgi:YD repeat-containing protein
VGIVAIFAVLSVLGTYPLILNFTSAVPAGGDSWAYYWNLHWLKRVLIDLHVSPFFAPDLYFPYGASLYFHTLNLLPGAIASPLVAVWGVPAAYNVIVLLSFVTTGYATYRLAWYVMRTDAGIDVSEQGGPARIAAVLAGVVFTFSTYRYLHLLGHLDLVSTQWLPCFTLFLLKTVRERGPANPILAGVFFAAAALTASYYLLFLVVFGSLFAAWTLIRDGTSRRVVAVRLAGSAVVALLLLSPVVIPMVRQGNAAGRTPSPAYDIDRFSGDLASLVVPSPLPSWSRNLGQTARASMARPGTTTEGVLFLGYLPLLLAAVALGHRAGRGFWLFSFLVFTVLSLGPTVYALGRPVPFISTIAPYRLLLALPFGDIPRVPARFIVMAGLSLSMLAAVGARRLLRRQSTRAGLVIATIGAMVVAAEHAVVPLPLLAVDVPPYYRELARSADRRAVVEVPIPGDPSAFPQRMRYQTVHQLPIYGGYLSRGLPPLPFSAIPGFSQFASLSESVDDVVSYDAGELRAISRTLLDIYGAGHVVIDRALLSQDELGRAIAIADGLFGPRARTYEDAQLIAYAVPPSSPGPATVWLDVGWSYLERTEAAGADGRPVRWRWMGASSRVGVTSPDARSVRLTLHAQAFGRPRRLQLSIAGAPVAVVQIGVNQGEHTTPPIAVARGATFITATSLDGADVPGQDRRLLSVALYRLSINNNK